MQVKICLLVAACATARIPAPSMAIRKRVSAVSIFRSPYAIAAKILPLSIVVSIFVFGALSCESGKDSSASAKSMETLVAADMLDHLRTLLAAAGEDKPEDYDLKWANFAGGPSVIAAATGGSVDVGWMAETPLVFSQ